MMDARRGARQEGRYEISSHHLKTFAFTFSTFFSMLLFLLCSQKKAAVGSKKKQREKTRKFKKTFSSNAVKVDGLGTSGGASDGLGTTL